MFFDPFYWLMLLVILGLTAGASLLVQGTFNRYSKVNARCQLTGAEVAGAILQSAGIYNVGIERVSGSLTDHYDPGAKTLRLSQVVYDSTSIAAIGVAAHEVGHAIQDAKAYRPLQFRSMWVPFAATGSQISMILIIVALFLGGMGTVFGSAVAWLGLIAFACTTLFTLATLPVEFDASIRAQKHLKSLNILDAEERRGSANVLRAAALTYVAAAIASLLQLLYWYQALNRR